jgi:hypothetical protein
MRPTSPVGSSPGRGCCTARPTPRWSFASPAAGWAEAEGLWSTAYAAQQRAAVATARAAYRRAFLRQGRLWANAPERAVLTPVPRFRHGVCEGRCGWFGWTERSARGRFLCPHCMVGPTVAEEAPPPMEVNSVGLLPAYLGSDILSAEESAALLEHILAQRLPSGHIPTVPGTEGCVGYDPGLLLGALVKAGHPAAAWAAERALRLLDGTQAWVEYYDADDRPRGTCCRCRPWESGINAEALLEALAGSGA